MEAMASAAMGAEIADRTLFRLLWLSIAAAVATIALKTTAWALTGSVGLLSDAAESGVNLAAAVVAMGALRWAARPVDEEHAYGHTKAEYFSAGVEGALIFIAPSASPSPPATGCCTLKGSRTSASVLPFRVWRR
jgi:divalent metal cation (Fe/Co/Zn/Cd) transporter